MASPAGASGAATTFTVSGFGDGTGSCSPVDANGNSACTTLRAAVKQASLQGNIPTINLQSGTFQLTAGNGGQLDLASSMNIIGAGPGGPSGTTIQQTDGKNRVLEIDGTSKLSGLEITGGHDAPVWSNGQVVYGGGILVLGVLTLDNSLITGNQAVGATGPATTDIGDTAMGGGIAYGSTAAAGSTITNSTISGNSATGGAGGIGAVGGNGEGGGLAYEGLESLIIRSTAFAQNTATGGAGGHQASGGARGGEGDGGAIFNPGGIVLTGSTIAANTATGGAQGGGSPTPPPTSFGGAGQGGGIFSQEGSNQLVDSTIFGNAALGGAAATGGSAGISRGGGLFAEGTANTASAELQSVTVDANQADQAANLGIDVGTAAPYPVTIHDTIVSGGTPTNCQINTPPSSESYNLEDDAADSCGFSVADHDLVGVSPELPGALASNGGPTQTLEPALGSPVLGAGGQCTDPTSNPPSQPLTVDERGEPRIARCDIGAFQAQSPKVTVLPAVSGSATRGQTLLCSQGSWTGDGGPFGYAFAWLRNGVPIPGATTNTYVVGTADPGQSLACRVTASYYGSGVATSTLVTVTSYPVITILKVSVNARGVVVTLGCRGADGQRCMGLGTLTTFETLRRGKVRRVSAGKPQGRERMVIVGQQGYSVLARHTATITITGKNGARLLKRFKSLPVLLTITQSTGAGTSAVASRKLTLRPLRAIRRRS